MINRDMFQEEDINASMILNLTGSNIHGEGYAFGREASLKNQAYDHYEGNRRVTYFYPLDIIKRPQDRWNLFGKSEFLARRETPIEVITEPGCKFMLPKGVLSPNLPTILLINPQMKNMPSELSTTPGIALIDWFTSSINSYEMKYNLVYTELQSLKSFVNTLSLGSEITEQLLSKINMVLDLSKKNNQKEDLESEEGFTKGK